MSIRRHVSLDSRFSRLWNGVSPCAHHRHRFGANRYLGSSVGRRSIAQPVTSSPPFLSPLYTPSISLPKERGAADHRPAGIVNVRCKSRSHAQIKTRFRHPSAGVRYPPSSQTRGGHRGKRDLQEGADQEGRGPLAAAATGGVCANGEAGVGRWSSNGAGWGGVVIGMQALAGRATHATHSSPCNYSTYILHVLYCRVQSRTSLLQQFSHGHVGTGWEGRGD